jgi:hypothetical protein
VLKLDKLDEVRAVAKPTALAFGEHRSFPIRGFNRG